MVYKNFRLICIFRVLFLGATCYLFFYLITRTTLYAMSFIAGVIIIYEIYSLIHYVERTNRDLTRFLDAIKYEDFSQTFIGAGFGSSFNDLKNAFNAVLTKFQQTRAEKEEHFRYLQTVVQHIGIGLISFQSDGEVGLINNAARRLLKVVRLKNINELRKFSKTLVDTLLNMKSGEKALVKIRDSNEYLQLAIYATEFILRENKYTLVSLQNIQSELEEKEMEAWQNLIRVLTHEIMNSVTPISSLASTANEMLTKNLDRKDKFCEELIDDVRGAVQTIEKRSKGLLHFVESYRKLTRIPRPNFEIFPVTSLFERVGQLMKTQIGDNQVQFETHVDPESLELTADAELVEQVLINLVLNSIDAVKNRQDGKIQLTSKMDERGRVIIQVIDNGIGLEEDILEKIFIPFFTTKEHGSGIGLSLSKQIMRLHRGTIAVQSKRGEETVFTLRF
jgi:nitrogen fixation/metabolism regulation signal transduction histidine kinase